MDKDPRISVIMGIYNCASTLQEALDSLYAQTFQDFEIILCEDGSSDNTYQVAEENAQIHKNIVLLKNETNKGLNYTLNRCLSVAKGEYIARMDGDDVCMSNRFAEQVSFLNKHKEFALVSSPMVMFDSDGDWGRTYVIEFPQKKDFIKYAPFFTHAAVMMRRNVYEAVGGYTVDKKFLRVEDCNLWYKVYALGYKGANLLEPLYKMRDDRNATRRRSWMARRNAIYVTYDGFKKLHMPWYSYFHLVKMGFIEIAKYMMPNFMYEYFHRRRK